MESGTFLRAQASRRTFAVGRLTRCACRARTCRSETESRATLPPRGRRWAAIQTGDHTFRRQNAGTARRPFGAVTSLGLAAPSKAEPVARRRARAEPHGGAI